MIVSKTDDLISEDYRPVPSDSGDELRAVLSAMSWQELSALKIDKGGVSMEGSGSNDDGFSIVVYENGNETVTPSEPSYSDMADMLARFYQGDDEWRNHRAWMNPDFKNVQKRPFFSVPSVIIKAVVIFGAGYAFAQLIIWNGE